MKGKGLLKSISIFIEKINKHFGCTTAKFIFVRPTGFQLDDTDQLQKNAQLNSYQKTIGYSIIIYTL